MQPVPGKGSVASLFEALKSTQDGRPMPKGRLRRRKLKVLRARLGLSQGFFRKKRTPGRDKEFRQAVATLKDPEMRRLALETWGSRRLVRV